PPHRHRGGATGSRDRASKRRGRRGRRPAKDGLKLAYDEVAGGTGDINRLVQAVGEEKDAGGWIDEGDVDGCQRLVYPTGVIWSWRGSWQTDDAGDREYLVGSGCRHSKQPRSKRDPEAKDDPGLLTH